jgi:hypothetical protein
MFNVQFLSTKLKVRGYFSFKLSLFLVFCNYIRIICYNF